MHTLAAYCFYAAPSSYIPRATSLELVYCIHVCDCVLQTCNNRIGAHNALEVKMTPGLRCMQGLFGPATFLPLQKKSIHAVAGMAGLASLSLMARTWLSAGNDPYKVASEQSLFRVPTCGVCWPRAVKAPAHFPSSREGMHPTRSVFSSHFSRTGKVLI
jgi:hypothetical protein